MTLNERQTHRKPWSPVVDFGSTGELPHEELVIKGVSGKDTQKTQMKRQVTPVRKDRERWGTTSTSLVFVVVVWSISPV